MNVSNKIIRLILVVVVLITYSCTQDDISIYQELPDYHMLEIKQIPLEQALSSLDNFMKNNESKMVTTRSGSPRTISKISTYFGNEINSSGFSTRGYTEDDIPDAYIINFDNNEGFAVLGANNAVAEIVAVTENGQIRDDLVVVFEELEDDRSYANNNYYDDDENEIIEETISWYCIEDDDFYSAATAPGEIITECIRQGIKRDFDSFNVPVIEFDNTNIEGYCTPTPILLSTNWGQLNPYNIHCMRTNLIGEYKSAYTGCSTTALAMIMVHNEFPQTLVVNGNQMNWNAMKTDAAIEMLSNEGFIDVSMLMASIFTQVKKISTKNFTLITPKQIEKRMDALGYTNVKRSCSSDFTYKMRDKTMHMLVQGKPVFISAIPKNWSQGHSWVIDGAEYSSNDISKLLFHFNFGWEGRYNGYFSISCLNPTNAEEYDNPKEEYIYDPTRTYTWHFRLITYDIPSKQKEVSINFSY